MISARFAVTLHSIRFPRALLESTLTLVLLALLFPALSIATQDHFTGKVVGVSDGDTVSVMRDGMAVKVRLAGIDCPEKAQPFGSRAKRFTSDAAFAKDVTVRVHNTDRYGRLVGSVILPDGRSLNVESIRAGLAWWYRQYAPGDKNLEALEAEARSSKRGLWTDKDPVAPWEWRKGTRTSKNGQAVVSGAYHGNDGSKVFHKPGCRHYDCQECTAVFVKRDQALGAGYRPCGVCKP